jgi:hypothetical protein
VEESGRGSDSTIVSGRGKRREMSQRKSGEGRQFREIIYKYFTPRMDGCLPKQCGWTQHHVSYTYRQQIFLAPGGLVYIVFRTMQYSSMEL